MFASRARLGLQLSTMAASYPPKLCTALCGLAMIWLMWLLAVCVPVGLAGPKPSSVGLLLDLLRGVARTTQQKDGRTYRELHAWLTQSYRR